MNKCKTCGWMKFIRETPGGEQFDTVQPWCLLWADHAGLAFAHCKSKDHKPIMSVEDDAKW